MNKKMEYSSPSMEILDARIERGYEGSVSTSDTFDNPTGNDRYASGDELGSRFS